MADTPATLVTRKEAAQLRGLTVDQLRGLERKHGGSFVASRGKDGRGNATKIDLTKLDAVLPGAGAGPDVELARRKAAVLDRIGQVLRARFADMRQRNELPKCGRYVAQLTLPQVEEITAYCGEAAVMAVFEEMLRSGIETPTELGMDRQV